MAEKNKYWSAILYPENMIENWKDEIGDIVQLPYAYCLHDKDLDKDGDDRKVHLHLVLAFPNTTTMNHAKNIYSSLSREGAKCLSTLQGVNNIRHIYDYLIHDTEDSKKKGKHLYDKKERVTGNGFDIGAFEQLGLKEKNDIAKKLCNCIVQENFTNFTDFYMYVVSNYDTDYFEVLKSNSGLFERLTRGNYQKAQIKSESSDEF